MCCAVIKQVLNIRSVCVCVCVRACVRARACARTYTYLHMYIWQDPALYFKAKEWQSDLISDRYHREVLPSMTALQVLQA